MRRIIGTVPQCSLRQTSTPQMQIKISQEQFLYVFPTTEQLSWISRFNKQFWIIENAKMEISDSKSWILGNCRWRAGTQQLLYVPQTALTPQCTHLMWQGSYAFPKAAPRAYSPWAVIKIRCLLRHFKDKAEERRAMWFTTLLAKSRVSLSSHDAQRQTIRKASSGQKCCARGTK